jgi:muconolactone D-isomerase
MLFHVHMDVNIPADIDPARLERLNAAEHEQAAALQRDGRWLHLWRVAGSFENISVFSVENAEELHDIVSSLPLHPFMRVQVTALARHPGAISYIDATPVAAR